MNFSHGELFLQFWKFLNQVFVVVFIDRYHSTKFSLITVFYSIFIFNLLVPGGNKKLSTASFF